MAKKRKRGSSRSKKLPLLIVAPMAAIAVESAKKAMETKSMEEALYPMTGYAHGSLHYDRLAQSYVPLAIGIVGHKVLGRYVNRYIPKWIPASL